MKFTFGWLKDHLETEADLISVTEKLTALGLEVEGVQDRAAAFAPFAVAYVEKAEKHPDADRLKVCVVDTGREKLQVVCGAPNARQGMKAVFAPAGSVIPGTGDTLKKGVIRGQESNGMLVSEREMGLSDEHNGIIEVDASVPVGTPFAALYGLDDPVVEIGLTPNRADCAGIRGIARDLAAAGIGALRDLEDVRKPGTFKSPVAVRLEFDGETKSACPLFLGRAIRGVKNGPSPKWMQDRLKAVGLRPISALVDITNYLSLDLCRPLHVFDADKLNGDIHVRLAKKGESFKALNEKTYELDDFMTVVCDDKNVLGLGGVMGGDSTGCTPETVNVFIECAYFDPHRTARTGRALQIDSDARYRFERGVDPAFTLDGMDIATKLVMDLCGGEPSEIVTAGAVPDWKRSIAHDPAYVEQLSGTVVSENGQKEILEKLGFTVSDSGKAWAVQPPSWRGDIEGRADLVEEIVRVYGYDRIPPVSMTKDGAVTKSPETLRFARGRKARTVLAARGMDECVTWSFMPADKADLFGSNDNQTAAALRVMNPISAELSQMRPGLLPNLIEAAGRNRDRGFADVALFEVGPAFASQKIDGQVLVAAGIRAAHKGPRHWSGTEASRPVDLSDVKADVFAVLSACGGPSETAQITRDAPGWYHPGRSATVRLGANVLARFGEIHPALLEAYGIRDTLVGFEIFLDAIPQPKKKPGTARPLLALSPFQPVSRDFAFIVDAGIEADAIIRAARGADKNLIQSVELFDIYAGKGIEPGKKSVAIAVTIQPREQTLTDKELEAVSEKIVGQVIGKTGGRLRA
jgi:phenylalanyl-tRNA synthetase beta chain